MQGFRWLLVSILLSVGVVPVMIVAQEDDEPELVAEDLDQDQDQETVAVEEVEAQEEAEPVSEPEKAEDDEDEPVAQVVSMPPQQAAAVPVQPTPVPAVVPAVSSPITQPEEQKTAPAVSVGQPTPVPAQVTPTTPPVTNAPAVTPETEKEFAQAKPMPVPEPIQKPQEIKPVFTAPQPQPAPTVQQVPEKQPEPQKPEQKVGPDFDTVNLEEPSGNWLYKAVWYKKAKERLGKLQEKFTQLSQARMPFSNQRNEIEEKVFEPLYLEIGMGQGEMTVILSQLIEEITKLREREGVLTKEEREFLDTLLANEKELEQLKLDVQAMAKLDNEVDEALNKLTEQIDLCRTYEQEAWGHIQRIEQELSDSVARQLYYQVETLEKNVSDILTWAKTKFTEHFAQLIKTANEQAQRIKVSVKALKEKGIDFKKQAEKIMQDAAQRDKQKVEQPKEVQAETAPASWTDRIIGVWDSIIDGAAKVWQYSADGLSAVYSTVKGWFVAEEEPSVQPKPQELKPVTAPTSGPEQSLPAQHNSTPVQQPQTPAAQPVNQQQAKYGGNYNRGTIKSAMYEDDEDVILHPYGTSNVYEQVG